MPRHPSHCPWPPAADWWAEAEIEFWRDLAKHSSSFESIKWSHEILEMVEAEYAARHRREQPEPSHVEDFRELVRDVKRKADILSVFAGRLGYDGTAGTKRQGDRQFLRCPFHHDDTPSLVLYLRDDSWWCFGCNVGGDAITAAMMLDDLEFVPAVLELAREYGAPMPRKGGEPTPLRLKTIA